jgi:hypothetical protein
MTHAVANFSNREDYGTMILDRVGRILSCGAPVERMFRASQVRMVGRRVSDFVAGLFLGGSSPSFSARYLVHLCADGVWRKFEAKDAEGRPLTVELSLSRITTDGQEMFLLNVRRPDESASS